MAHRPCLSCLNASIDFPPFYNSLVSNKKHICTHSLSRPHPSGSYKAIFASHTRTHACQLRAPTLPAHHLSPSARSPLSLCHSFQTRCGSLEYNFGQINSWCFAPRLFLALTQTATSW
ncbi:unnamed protein product [Hymenolepis diminuta]|uniref:Uncharacterized protein n=1 Tax=Hymenolepis diminuta TaxID=6216 RepID=A0A564Y813_HYMDI|nr:unnamed protein product [Hymenolepis diminuta]